MIVLIFSRPKPAVTIASESKSSEVALKKTINEPSPVVRYFSDSLFMTEKQCILCSDLGIDRKDSFKYCYE